jgi:hypothetical protein
VKQVHPTVEDGGLLGGKLPSFPTYTERCPTCGRCDWWYRPDGTRLCGSCVKAAGTRGGDSG